VLFLVRKGETNTVFDEKGRPCRVVAKSAVDNTEQAYKLTFKDGSSIVAGASIPNCLHQNHIIKGRSNGTINPRFALYYLISGYGRKQIQKVSSSTSGLYTLSANKVRSLVIPECNERKQHEVVSEIESRLSVCDSIEQTVDIALQQAEAMRQSILKQAFEGRL
jgi:type I restriction enzyme S subunit